MSQSHLKEEVNKLFEDRKSVSETKPIDNPRTRKISYPQGGLQDIAVEPKRSRLYSPPWQFLGLAVVLIPLIFVVKSCIAPGTSAPKPEQQLTGVARTAQAAVICGPANQTDPYCELQRIKGDQNVQERKSKLTPPPQPPPTVKPPQRIVRQVPQVVRIAQAPQQYQSQFQPQPVFRQQVRQRPFSAPVRERRSASAEQIWESMSKDGVSSSGGNSFTPPVQDAAYVSENGTQAAMTAPIDLAPSFKGKPKGEGEGKLMEPVQLTADVDAAEEEYEIKVTKAFAGYPEGAILYAKIEGTPSQAGFITLRPVGSSQGDISSQNIEIKKPDGGMIKASMKGTGRGIGNTIASILFGGVRIAMGGIFGGGGALNSIGQNASNEGINAAQNAFQNRRAAPYFEVSKGTTVKILLY